MNILLDAHAFLWWVNDDSRLSPAARKAIAKGDNPLYLSAASGWEIAIKFRLGRLHLPEPIDRFLMEQMAVNGIDPLPVQMKHALHTRILPDHHRDPFDRLLIAQALLEDLVILTADAAFHRYGVKVIW